MYSTAWSPSPRSGSTRRTQQGSCRIRVSCRMTGRLAEVYSSAASKTRHGPAPGVRPARQSVLSVDQVEGHEVRRPRPRRLSGSCPAPGEPLLKSLERQPVPFPHHQLAVQCRRVRQLAAPDSISGNEAARLVPRRECGMIRPASTETRARHPSHFGLPAHPGSSAGSDTGAASIGFRQCPRHSPCIPLSPPVGKPSARAHPTTGPTMAGQRTTAPCRGLCAELLAHGQVAAQPDIGCPGSRVVRSDVAAAHRPQRISPNPAVPPERPRDRNQ
jgi:hypothetical protein